MKTTEQRITALHRKTQELQLRREKNMLFGLAAVSFLLLVSVTRLARNSAGILYGGPDKLTGASLLNPSVGGYVMAAVLAFMAGVAVTIIIIRRNMKNRNSEIRDRKLETTEDQNSDSKQ